MSIPHTTARPRTHSDTLPPAPHDDTPVPPHDDASEMSVIGSVLLSPDCFCAVAEILPAPAAFYGLYGRAIYGAMLILHAKGLPIDGVTIRARLTEQGFPGIKDAFQYMERAVNCVPSAGHVKAYTQTVYDRWQDRQIQSALHAATQGTLAGATRESVISTLTAALARLAPATKSEKQWPVMGDAAYHGVAGELVGLIDPHTEADPVATLMQFLIAFGSAAGRNIHFQIGASHHYLNLFGCLMGATNAGRKGTSLDGALLPIRLLDPDWANDCQAGGLSSGEGLIHSVRDTRYQGEDVIDEGVSDKRLLVVETELAAPIQRMGREGNTLSTIIRQAWDSGRLRTMTKGSPVRATDAHISIIAHVTPDELRRLLTANDQTNGFANRFVWCLVRRSKYLPFGGRIDEVLLSPILDRLREAMAFAKESREIIMSAAAAEAWIPEYRRLTADAPGIAGAMTARGAPIVRRLACIYACLDCSAKVELPHLQAALALWDYCRESVEYVFGDAGAKKESAEEKDRRELVERIESNGGRITPRKLCQSSRRFQPTEVAEAALEKLIAAGLGKWEINTPEGICKPITEFVLFTPSTRLQSTLPSNTGQNVSNVDVDTVDTPEKDIPIPPDDDHPSVSYLEDQAEAEMARQAQSEDIQL